MNINNYNLEQFNLLLQSLINNNCDILYNYNHFILKKFFEFAFQSEKYLNIIKNGNSGLRTNLNKSIKHEKLLFTACISSLEYSKNISIYKQYYSDYLFYKSKKMIFRGRQEWYDFHRTLFSHFIWEGKSELMIWTWKNMINCLIGEEIQKMSNWRRKWYLSDLNKYKQFITKVCLITNRNHIIEYILEKNIFKINKKIKDILMSYGYTINSDKKLVVLDFTKTKECKFLNNNTELNINKNDIDIKKCISLCMKIKLDKNRIINLFKELSNKDCWIYFSNISLEELKFITCKNISKILSNSCPDLLPLKEDCVLILFKYNNIITKTLLSNIFSKIKNFEIDLEKTLNILCKIIKSKKPINYFSLQMITNQYVNILDRNRIKLPNNLIKKNIYNHLSVEDLYCLYKILPLHIHLYLNDILNIQGRKIYSNNQVCAICLNNNSNANSTNLPCGHIFHKDCINNDLLSARYNNCSYSDLVYNCPICRSKIHHSLLQKTLNNNFNDLNNEKIEESI